MHLLEMQNEDMVSFFFVVFFEVSFFLKQKQIVVYVLTLKKS